MLGHEPLPPVERRRVGGVGLIASPRRNGGAAGSCGRKAVLELFTSQGCSSCPPADALLAQLGKQPGLVTLSYSVDYWNYLGWHDTLSSAANSERQREYARMRGDGRVYTPQIVVDGLIHVNGSNEAAIEMAMRNAAKRLADVKVPVNMHAEGDTLVIGIGAAPEKSDKRVSDGLAGDRQGGGDGLHHPRRESRPRRSAITTRSGSLTPVGMWKGEAMTLRLPLKDLKADGRRLPGRAAPGGECRADSRRGRARAAPSSPEARSAKRKRAG